MQFRANFSLKRTPAYYQIRTFNEVFEAPPFSRKIIGIIFLTATGAV